MLEDAAGRAEQQRLGARSIPVLSRGDEFVSNDQSAVVSEETGTVYERVTGEPAVTPHDQVLEHEEEEEEDA